MPRALIIDNGTSYLSQLVRILDGFTVSTLPWQEFVLSKSLNFDLVILSGGHTLPVIGNEEKFSQELEFIRRSRNLIIGICFGFELIARAFGAELVKLERKEKGIVKIRAAENPIFRECKSFKVYEAHRWVVKELPKDLESLAESEDGVEFFRHLTRPIYGFQFHPEMFLRKTEGAKIFHAVLTTHGFRDMLKNK